MQRDDVVCCTWLLLIGALVWIQDLYWINSSVDTLSILVTFPLIYYLGKPWLKNKNPPRSIDRTVLGIFLLFFLGLLLENVFLMAVSWTCLAWSLLSKRLETPTPRHLKKLLVLALLGFPWILNETAEISSWIRISGAYATTMLYATLGFATQQEGAGFYISNHAFLVDQKCTGLQTLNGMLLIGLGTSYYYHKDSNRFWWNIPLIFSLAWLTNVLRMVLLTSLALAISDEFASGWIHEWGGLFVIGMMLTLILLCIKKSSS